MGKPARPSTSTEVSSGVSISREDTPLAESIARWTQFYEMVGFHFRPYSPELRAITEPPNPTVGQQLFYLTAGVISGMNPFAITTSLASMAFQRAGVASQLQMAFSGGVGLGTFFGNALGAIPQGPPAAAPAELFHFTAEISDPFGDPASESWSWWDWANELTRGAAGLETPFELGYRRGADLAEWLYSGGDAPLYEALVPAAFETAEPTSAATGPGFFDFVQEITSDFIGKPVGPAYGPGGYYMPLKTRAALMPTPDEALWFFSPLPTSL